MGGGFNRRCPISWEPYERGIQKISWGTSQFVEWAACEILSRSEMVAPKSEKFSENFRFIDARVTVRSWCSCINECYSQKSARAQARQYGCRAQANAIELTRGHPGKRGSGSCRS